MGFAASRDCGSDFAVSRGYYSHRPSKLACSVRSSNGNREPIKMVEMDGGRPSSRPVWLWKASKHGARVCWTKYREMGIRGQVRIQLLAERVLRASLIRANIPCSSSFGS